MLVLGPTFPEQSIETAPASYKALEQPGNS